MTNLAAVRASAQDWEKKAEEAAEEKLTFKTRWG